MPILTKLFTMQEVLQHTTRDDCWLVVDGKVYDVSSYLDEHPGGDDVLINAAGRGDATDDFNDVGHSQSAIDLMKEFCIGELDPSPPVIQEEEISTKKETTDLTHKFMDMTLQYWAIPVAIIGISVVAGMLYLRKK